MSSDAGTAPAILEADGVRVVFFRAGDRYAHRIEDWDAGQGSWQPVWESLEGTADEDWPPSPPLQQLHVERRADGPVALLIGMAGRTHWSAAVEVVRESGIPNAPRIVSFHVAARIKPGTATARLGSTYRRSAGRADGESAGIRPLRAIDETRMEMESGDEVRCLVGPADPLVEGLTTSTTIVWRYVFEPSK